MMRVADAIEIGLDRIEQSAPQAVRRLVIDHIPEVIQELAGDKLWDDLPGAYLRWLKAKALAARIVYREGTDAVESLPAEHLPAFAIEFLAIDDEQESSLEPSKKVIFRTVIGLLICFERPAWPARWEQITTVDSRRAEPPEEDSKSEVFCFRMVNHYRTGGLLRVDLMVLSQAATNAFRMEKTEQFCLISHIWACRIAKGISTATVLLPEEFFGRHRVIGINPKLRSHPLVPQLRQGFRSFDREAMQVQILGEISRFKQRFATGGLFANGHA